jgi:integrase
VVEVSRMAGALPDTLAGIRDRALLLLGFAAALRRSELANLLVEDVVEVDAGLEVTIRRSKTDQDGEGAVVPVRLARDPASCPVRAWQAWTTAADLTDGPAWRAINRHGAIGAGLSDRAITDILVRAATSAGVNTDGLSAHSLRAGYVTAAALGGASERAIAAVSRHQSVPVLRSYVRRATVWQDAATDLGW